MKKMLQAMMDREPRLTKVVLNMTGSDHRTSRTRPSECPVCVPLKNLVGEGLVTCKYCGRDENE